MSTYIFRSERLGFRNWNTDDFDQLFDICADPKVMRFFPSIYSKKDTENFILRNQQLFAQKQYCYFAVELLDKEEFIGFIGLSDQDYLPNHTSVTDIGWRLKKEAWNKGYATEGAITCLDYGFNIIELQDIFSIAPEINTNSIHVMKKIGMKKVDAFKHPKLSTYKKLENCVLYQKSK